MQTGSFWTQPLGQSHITSAKGKENIALVEIDNGPYLVKPTEKAFDSEERSINIDAENVVGLIMIEGIGSAQKVMRKSVFFSKKITTKVFL